MIIAIAALARHRGDRLYARRPRPTTCPSRSPFRPCQHLEERKAAIYENLRDLQFEYRVGKLSDADYQADQDRICRRNSPRCWPKSTAGPRCQNCAVPRRRGLPAAATAVAPRTATVRDRLPATRARIAGRSSPKPHEVLRRMRQADAGGGEMKVLAFCPLALPPPSAQSTAR